MRSFTPPAADKRQFDVPCSSFPVAGSRSTHSISLLVVIQFIIGIPSFHSIARVDP